VHLYSQHCGFLQPQLRECWYCTLRAQCLTKDGLAGMRFPSPLRFFSTELEEPRPAAAPYQQTSVVKTKRGIRFSRALSSPESSQIITLIFRPQSRRVVGHIMTYQADKEPSHGDLLKVSRRANFRVFTQSPPRFLGGMYTHKTSGSFGSWRKTVGCCNRLYIDG
jgi:hypothetical protein